MEAEQRLGVLKLHPAAITFEVWSWPKQFHAHRHKQTAKSKTFSDIKQFHTNPFGWALIHLNMLMKMCLLCVCCWDYNHTSCQKKNKIPIMFDHNRGTFAFSEHISCFGFRQAVVFEEDKRHSTALEGHFESCSQQYFAKQDVFILLNRSANLTKKSCAGPTKWDYHRTFPVQQEHFSFQSVLRCASGIKPLLFVLSRVRRWVPEKKPDH